MADDDGGGSPGFLGVEVITSSESSKSIESSKGGSESSESSKGGALFFSAACIPNAHKPQAPHFASLTMRVDRGHHCLVVGGTAARRAAVFKALLGTHALGGGLAGVVSPGAGAGPSASGALIHVSSRPYVKPGSSLWDALIFPHDKTQSLKRGVGERQLAAVLRRLDFGFLLARAADDWGRVVDWAKVLGAGELYALALARLVYHSPPFALLDDATCLRADQLRQLFAIARRHHVTLVVASAAPDPFDPARRGAPPVECLAEFTRALRLADDDDGGWAFCGFGYAPQRAAFGCDEPCDFVWADADADALPPSSASSAASAADLRLRRRVSALSQCSTTERRWLTTTQAAEPADASRRQSRVVSPTLTARSSLSDINADGSIGRALSARAAMLLLPATPTSDCADSCEPPGSSSSATPSHPSSRASSAAHSSSSRSSDYEPPSGKSEPPSAKSESLDPVVVPVSALPIAVSETEPVFSPAKNPYARPKNVQRSRPSLSLFSAAKQQQPPSPAADVSRRPFSRNGEEGDDQSAEAKDEGAKAAAGIATPITPITPTTTAFAAAPAAKIRQVSATVAPPPSAGSAAASNSTPSRIPRPPSSVSRVDRTSQQIDSSSVTSLMATLSITSGGGGSAMATTTTKLSTAGDADQLTLDEFTAALNNM
ncbi:ATP-binding cassette sub- D member 1 [Coemansia sp. RSA 25]|nr:ATP-binding cassette sub- D member 1 [Coemansia sp. RSA 25]